jgi:hypothetical protein
MDFAKKTFDQFGQYRRDYFVTRGNHDRAHSGAQYRTRAGETGGGRPWCGTS